MPTNANVLLTVPPSIPGRPDLGLPGRGRRGQRHDHGSDVGAAGCAQRRPAALSLIPLPPSDQQAPVYPFAVRVLTTIALDVPDGDVLISGQLVDSLQESARRDVRRPGVQNGAQVSNAPADPGRRNLPAPDSGGRGGQSAHARAAARSSVRSLGRLCRRSPSSPGKKLGTITLPATRRPAGTAWSSRTARRPLSPASWFARRPRWARPAGSGPLSGTAQYAATGSTDATGNVEPAALARQHLPIAATPAGRVRRTATPPCIDGQDRSRAASRTAGGAARRCKRSSRRSPGTDRAKSKPPPGSPCRTSR